MSVQQSVTTGLIGLVIAGAGAVGIYNYTSSGCFLGSCSTGASADSGEAAAVGLPVSGLASEAGGDSCCAAKDPTETQVVGLGVSEEAARDCEVACEYASGEQTLAAGETMPECCATALAEKADSADQTDAPATDG